VINRHGRQRKLATPLITLVLVKIRVFWDFMRCHWSTTCRRFDQECYSYLRGQESQSFFLDRLTQKKALQAFEMSVT